MHHAERRNQLLPVIGVFKLLKAGLLFIVALGFHHLLKPDSAEIIAHWARVVRVDPESIIFRAAATRLTGLSHRRLEELSAGTFFYGSMFAVEGTGLLLRKRWAEYFTTISTAAFLPLEGYEFLTKASVLKATVLAINIAIVVYLIVAIVKTRRPTAADPGL